MLMALSDHQFQPRLYDRNAHKILVKQALVPDESLPAVTAFATTPPVVDCVRFLCWVNDEDSLRAYESNDDAYRKFRRMLEPRRQRSMTPAIRCGHCSVSIGV